MGIVDKFRKAQQPEEQPAEQGAEEQPVDQPVEEPAAPSYPPEKVEQALSTGDNLIGLHFDKLALMIEHNAGVAQELGQVHRKRFYGYFIDQVKLLKEQFQKELNPEGGYEPPPKPKNSYAKPKGLKPWHRYD